MFQITTPDDPIQPWRLRLSGISYERSGGRIPVAVAVVIKGGRLLIAQRFSEVHLPDLWEFPGGKIDAGETPEECAIRELKEELGIDIEILGFLIRRTYDYID